MKAICLSVLMLMATMAVVMQGQDNPNANQLADAAKHAHDARDLPKQVDDLCRAAALDSKFQKRCDKAKEDLSRSLAQFDAAYNQAVFEAQHKDFPGAVRDLSKITFGPHRDSAQALVPQLRVAGHMGSPEEISRMAMQLANAFYAAGRLDDAEAWLKYVTVPGLQAAQNQMETNIRSYRQAMQEANELLIQHNFNDAAQKFQFAAIIAPNGPGNPKGQLQQVQEQIAAMQHSTTQVNSQQSAAIQKDPNAAKIQSLLSTGSKNEERGNMRGAARAYAAALALDPNQKDAIEGQKRVLTRLVDDPKALETLLEQGVMQFYAAQYTQANDTIGSYLAKGGRLHEGAAQFYMGASLTAIQIMADPKDIQHSNDLRQQAQVHFEAARKLRFEPVKNAVSPKILKEWTQVSETR
jgi:hypothetical protein